MGGPRSALENYVVALIDVIPDKGESSDLAKKVKSELMRIFPSAAEKTKKIPLDDFIRVLPSGGGRITRSSTNKPPLKFEI